MLHKGPDQEKVQKGLRLQLKVLKVTLNGENVYLLSDEEVALYMHFNGSLDLSIRNDRVFRWAVRALVEFAAGHPKGSNAPD